MFEISTFEFVLLNNFTKKTKMSNLGPKMPYLGTFGLEFEKAIVIFKIRILEFV